MKPQIQLPTENTLGRRDEKHFHLVAKPQLGRTMMAFPAQNPASFHSTLFHEFRST
jgi:hypothetical protein